MRADGAEARDAVDDINRQVKAIDLVKNGELERRVDVAFLFVSPHMKVVMIPAAVAELVDECRVGVEVEDDRLVDSEKRIEVAVREPVRMFALWHEAKK